MNNITTARETIGIIEEGGYVFGGRTVRLTSGDPAAVEVISPEKGKALVQKMRPAPGGTMCRFTLTGEDSFQAAARFQRPLVMNFANAHSPGGGFLLGANAQEEALCRCSTLYASISSKAAKEMYRFNNTHPSRVESDYMLLSEDVCVFRGPDLALLEKPFNVGVVTVPAPNRRGAAMLASKALCAGVMGDRIRVMCAAAAEKGYRDLILGAWGCGAFGNDPKTVSGLFREILIDENFGSYFDNVCFAIYGRPDSKNAAAFSQTFEKELDTKKSPAI
ncbi:MAG: TIGR02452 family protein [Ruminococcus sp.]|nr:TIGR02452 family protein [Ruminococcus sp.]